MRLWVWGFYVYKTSEQRKLEQQATALLNANGFASTGEPVRAFKKRMKARRIMKKRWQEYK